MLLMGLRSSLEEIAKKKKYRMRELKTGKWELRKDFLLVSVAADIDSEEGVQFRTIPNYLVLLVLTVLFAATFIPLVVLVYLVYAIVSWFRKKSVEHDLRNMNKMFDNKPGR